MTENTMTPGAFELLVFDRRFHVVGGVLAAVVFLTSMGFLVAANRPSPRPREASSVLPAQAYRIPLMRGVPYGFPIEPKVEAKPVAAPAPTAAAAKPAARPPMVVASRRR